MHTLSNLVYVLIDFTLRNITSDDVARHCAIINFSTHDIIP